MRARERSVFTKEMVEEDVGAFAAHKKRISDFLNDGAWHHVTEDGSWVFRDSETDKIESSVQPMHLR